MLASLAFSFLLCAPVFARAEAVSLIIDHPTSAHTRDVILVPVNIQVAGDPGINTLDATVSVSGPAEIVSVQTGGSVFSLWPVKEVGVNSVHVVGGTPSSVYGSLKAFTIALRITGEGSIGFESSGTAYLGDGSGTPEKISSPEASIEGTPAGDITVDALTSSIQKDRTPPESFAITPSRDESVFGGAYFLSFSTVDAGSGVVKYEVSEGDLPVVESDGTYVLRDQSESKSVTVRAYDAAGNVREEVFVPNKPVHREWTYVVGVLLLAGIIGVLTLRVRRKRSGAES